MSEAEKLKRDRAIREYADTMYLDEVGYLSEHYPDKFEKLTQLQRSACKASFTFEGTALARDIRDMDKLPQRIIKGDFNIPNAANRRLFAELTGITLPDTVNGTKDTLESYIGYVGGDLKTEYDRRKKQESEARRAARDAVDKSIDDRSIETLMTSVLQDVDITGDELVDLARFLDIDMCEETEMAIREFVVSINTKCSITRGDNALPTVVDTLYNVVLDKVEELNEQPKQRIRVHV